MSDLGLSGYYGQAPSECAVPLDLGVMMQEAEVEVKTDYAVECIECELDAKREVPLQESLPALWLVSKVQFAFPVGMALLFLMNNTLVRV